LIDSASPPRFRLLEAPRKPLTFLLVTRAILQIEATRRQLAAGSRDKAGEERLRARTSSHVVLGDRDAERREPGLDDPARGFAPEKLPGYAEEVGLDVAAFQKCLSSGKHAPGIREDMRTAQNLGITGTPAYLLGRRIPGGDKIQVLEIVKGVPKYEALEEKINALLTAK